jgi:hypothetical protein
MRHNNFTIQRALTDEELRAREQWLAEQRAAADAVNAQFMLAKQQQDAADRQQRLTDATGLPIETLVAIREWLKHN